MLTLITVNYRSARATIALLRSLESQGGQPFDVIVVDNDSPADDRALLAAYAATSPLTLDVIYSDTNRGFSGGNNIGIRKALAQGATWILCINPDTVAPTDLIAVITAAYPTDAALVGIPLREGDRTAYGGVIRWLAPTLPHAYLPIVEPSRHYTIGAGMLIHRSVFEQAGFLDERYFLYFEDIEFTLRARAAGIPVHFLEHPVIGHTVQGTTGMLGAPKLLRYHIRNALLLNRTHGPLWVQFALPFWAGALIARQLVKLAFMPSRHEQALALIAGIVDHYRGHYGIIA